MKIISIIAAFFIFSQNGVTPVGGLRSKLPDELKDADKQTRIAAGWYDYVSTAPASTTNEVVVCVGFKRDGDHFTGIYVVRLIQQTEEVSGK